MVINCQCKEPNPSCANAKLRIAGHYCQAEIDPKRTEKLGKLRHGQKFSFYETPWRINTIFANYGDRIVYQREDGWLLSTEDLDRFVNLII